jgi:hypothetical protein
VNRILSPQPQATQKTKKKTPRPSSKIKDFEAQRN